jgi:Cu(I)/Ag(I) efflux system membrane fusion protein
MTTKSKLVTLLSVLLVLSVTVNLYLVSRHAGAATGAAASASGATYVCPMHPTIMQDHPGDCPICGMKLVLKKSGEAARPAAATAPAPAPEPHEPSTRYETETVYTCPMDPQVVEHQPGRCPICGMNLEKTTRKVKVTDSVNVRRIAYYRSPMDAKITSPVPRRDDMGMDYVPVFEDQLNTAGHTIDERTEVTIDPARRQLIGLRTAPAVRGEIGGGWRTVGRVEVNPTQVAQVNVKEMGYVEKVMADFVGKPVRRGEALFSYYSPELYAAQQEYLLALRSRETLASTGSKQDGEALVDAVKQKLTLADVSEDAIKQLEESRQAQKTIMRVAPVSGVITAKNIVEGSTLMPGAIAYEITDLSSVWVIADAYQNDAARVKVGMKATLTVQGESGRVYEGKVEFVDPQMDPQSRTLKVRIGFANPKGELRPDMFGDVTLEGARHDALTIPADAVIPAGTRSLVFVSTGEGRFVPREVTLGATADGQVEVLAGLTEGEQVVTRANFLIDSESSLKAALAAAEGR